MSKEIAKSLAELIKSRDEQVAPILEGLADGDGRISLERLGEAARGAGWDVADHELASALQLTLELGDEELDEAAGGNYPTRYFIFFNAKEI